LCIERKNPRIRKPNKGERVNMRAGGKRLHFSVTRFVAAVIIGAYVFTEVKVRGQEYYGPAPFTEVEGGLLTGAQPGCLAVIQTVGFNSLGGTYMKVITITNRIISKTTGVVWCGKVVVKLTCGDELCGTVRIYYSHSLGKPMTCVVLTTYTRGTGRFAGVIGGGVGTIEPAQFDGKTDLFKCEKPIVVAATAIADVKGKGPDTE
jgi:hypothetical protein